MECVCLITCHRRNFKARVCSGVSPWCEKTWQISRNMNYWGYSWTMNMFRIYLISDSSWSLQALQTYSTAAAERRKAAHLKAEGECSWLLNQKKIRGPWKTDQSNQQVGSNCKVNIELGDPFNLLRSNKVNYCKNLSEGEQHFSHPKWERKTLPRLG